jgi:hypothetical protein
MAQYLQASTENPYGHRPWATRLYTGFDDFAYIKHPQNTVTREDPSLRPEIVAPPEFAMLGAETFVVNAAGRQMSPRRRGLGMLPAQLVRSVGTGYTFPAPVATHQAPIVEMSTSILQTSTPIAAVGQPVAAAALPQTTPTPAAAAASSTDASSYVATAEAWLTQQTILPGYPNWYFAAAAGAALLFFAKGKNKR